MTAPAKIRVLVVDDSALVRRLARETLQRDPDIEVVGVATDPYEARDRILQLKPDVLTLDLEMPRMDGLTFLTLLMERRPLPVVVMSSLSPRGSDFALEALRLGAVEVIGKPQGTYSFGDIGEELIAKVKAAAHANVSRRPVLAPAEPAGESAAAACDPRALILLGGSTGGVEAFRTVFSALPDTLPPIAIVQHIPALFSKNFSRRLDDSSAVQVKEAEDGDRLLPGTALVAPGGRHLLLRWSGTHYVARLSDGPALWHQRPAVDLLLRSAAEAGAGARCIAGILTGMGRDGADGLLRLRQNGAATFAQDESSCVVYGMPRAACENGAAQSMLPLARIPGYIARAASSAAHSRLQAVAP
ncbi:MAG TPA: chemotaxis response regulator protein-glutamate methylesterase [Opitutaceae bacterium]|jgi:two-component system chemotaxis response regulator CheB|nr:chemotaxis response regulator protein-glutamate methylesterase [Opitutaceae bacterium]